MEAFKQVCNEQVELARKYASRMVVFPWFVSSVDNYEKDLKAKLEKIRFSFQTTKQGNLGPRFASLRPWMFSEPCSG